MRMGAFILEPYHTPSEWVGLVTREGYGAAYCPVALDARPDEVERYANAAAEAGIVIAEVHAWSNPISRDPAEAERALALCQGALALAEAIGARCCVNVGGWRGDVVAGPDAGNLASGTFELIVESVQQIIDAVQPQQTYYTLETTPWIAPYDVDSYVQLVNAIDRERFAIHFDPVNLINDPHKYYASGDLVSAFVSEFGPRIMSCHVKDILIEKDIPPLRLHERIPGDGEFDWDTLLTVLAHLDPDLPIMMEHLEHTEDYRRGGAFIREVASRHGVEWRTGRPE